MAVYFIAALELGRVKIGFASDAWRRFSKVQSDSPCPLTMLAIVDGDMAVERGLHKRFASDRLHGEWFSLSADIQAHVDTLTPAERPRRSRFVTDLAEKVGISKGHMSQVLRGKWGCSARVALDIEKASNKEINASDLSPVIKWAREGGVA